MALTEPQIRRYARHILLPEMGGIGQEKLLGARARISLDRDPAGACVALAYLAAAGVGHLAVTDHGAAPVTQRDIDSGILYGTTDLGRPRLDCLRRRIGELNPDVTVEDGDGAAEGVPVDLDQAAASVEPHAVADALIRGGSAAAHTIRTILAQS